MTEVLQMASLIHTEQYYCNTSAHPQQTPHEEHRVAPFAHSIGTICRLWQALVYLEGTCLAQTTCVTGLQISNALHRQRSSICLLCASLSSQAFPIHCSMQETFIKLSLVPQDSSLWMLKKTSVQPAFWACLP